ncbi:MAG TPA: AMP-binding protein [Solirubrobacteraceae bacterium]|nr:AMP-binding protein [Solirubrobacteraceae bacterium]
MLVEAWLARAAAARPRLVALETPSGSWTYGELEHAALAGAAQLRELGAGPGVPVAIALPPGLEFARALHACLLLGAVAVPVDMRLPEGARAKVSAAAEVLVEEPLSAGARARGASARIRETHDLDAAAVVIHTSGTSAEPKAVTLTYGNLLWSALGSAAALGAPREERWLCALPLAHVGGLSILIRSAIYATTAIVHERFEAERVASALTAGEVTIVSVVATTLARLLDAGLRRPPALRCALTGGGPVPAQLLDRAYAAGVPVSITYGLTEAASQVTTTPLALVDLRSVAAGRATPGPPLFCSRVRIAGDGEILVGGPTVAPGALAGDGWLHTEDVGELDGHGRLLVTGRRSEVIISGGQNVSPAKVEAAIEAHPAVGEAAVIARADPEWGEAVSAIVVWREGSEADVDGVLALCARVLAPYEVPKSVSTRAEPLPRTASGKLVRRELM